jgi:phosphoribosylanthranilate isomerase
MFRIKICGVRRLEDVHAAADAGADAVGLNFFPPSLRYLDPLASHSAEIAQVAAERGLLRVGVVVNRAIDEIESLFEQVELDAVQLHGDEQPSQFEALRNDLRIHVIRAVKLPTGPLDPEQIERATRPWIGLDCHLLFDAEAGSAQGGSGQSLDWDAIHRWSERHPSLNYTLAGGLTPENVVDAIQRSGARSVDTASGVERPKGTKDADLIERFVKACQSAENWHID